jgi:acyl-coenzyme A synthetase/AMP-(fatty) acid ligase
MGGIRARGGPDQLAVVTEQTTITDGELEDRANRLARYLLTTGLGAGETVAVVTRRLPEVVIAMLAALKGGWAYAVIDPQEPMDEIGRMLAAVRAGVVVTDQDVRPRVDDGTGRRVVSLDAEADIIAACSPDPLDPPRGAPAAVLFTAGTTGPRRPVVVDHVRLRAAYDAWVEVFGLVPADRHLVTAPPDTAAFTGVWIRALCSGGTLVLPQQPVGPGVWEGSLTEGTTVLDTDPASAAALLDVDLPGTLRLVTVSGERLTVADQVRLHSRLPPGARLINVYGTAEVVGCGTWFETSLLADPVPDPERVSLLGRPFPGCRAEVHEGEIRLTPPDGGEAVPTADLGRLRDDGLLEFRGRRAHRITVGGRTIDPYPAEAALATHPEIREAVIASTEGALVAYVVPPLWGLPGIGSVRAHLHGVVPEAEIPEEVVFLGALPRNRAGMVDRRALPLPASETTTSGGGGKGGVPLTSEGWSLALRWLATILAFPVAVLFTGLFWPGSTDLTGVPQPWATLFVGLYFAEWLAFAAGVGFLLNGRAAMLRQGRSPVLTSVAHLAIGWLLVSWWPQDNLYRLRRRTTGHSRRRWSTPST